MNTIRRMSYTVRTLTMIFVGTLTTTAGAQSAPVTVEETAELYILDNEIVTARVAKASGDLVSLKYRGQEMFASVLNDDGTPDLHADPPGENLEGLNRGMTDHQYGFWSHDAMGKRGSEPASVARITIHPDECGGDRAEVSVKGVSGGTRAMGTGPGANRETGDFMSDVEIRYTLGRGNSGVFTYCIFNHPAGYPATSITEARFCIKLNDFFDWMLNDAKRNKLYPKESRENKYNYTANQFDNRAFGWASTSKGVGCFIINSSMEYMSGGPTKVEFLTHRDTNQVAAPCVLNYWRSSHYGGSLISVDNGEEWSKVIGPFLIYCNSGDDPQAMLADARAQAVREADQWPYDWVRAPEYPLTQDRGAVEGHFKLIDPVVNELNGLMVGLTHATYEVSGGRATFAVDWQRDAKHYQYWVRGAADGAFRIGNVRPGTYTLRAYADGVLGEFARADVEVRKGETVDLGQIEWTPVRRGHQVWAIGVPNRNSREFLKGDDYYHDGMQALYAELFPNDVTYTVGQSDYRSDVYYQHIPHATEESLKAAADYDGSFFRAPPVTGDATPWRIEFDLPETPSGGVATLRLAISGTGARRLRVEVNGTDVGPVNLGSGEGIFGGRNGIQGIWYERALPFDASLLKQGRNSMTLIVPAGNVNAGVMYDYLRLELDESAD